MNKTPVLIIGGGISGLSTAWWLAQQGIEVELWEADSRMGGKICSTKENGYITEKAAGLLVNYLPEIDQLVDAAGLASVKQTLGTDSNRYIIQHGQLVPVPMKMPAFASSSVISFSAKLRLLTEILIPRNSRETETVSHFIRRRLGNDILETLMDPFIAGTLASDPNLADANAVLPRLTALEKRYGSLTMGMLVNRVFKKRRANLSETFAFKGGMSDLVNALASTPGVQIKTNHKVTGIEPSENGWKVEVSSANGSRTQAAKHVVICTPAGTTAHMLSSLDNKLSQQLNGINYAPLSLVHIGLDKHQVNHPLNGNGYLTPAHAQLKCNGNLWMSSLFPNRAPDEKTLFTSYIGGARHPEYTDWSDTRLVDAALADQKQLLGVSGDPEYIRIDRHSQALPLYHGNYLGRVAEIDHYLSDWKGLHLSANYLHGVSVRDRILQGQITAQRIATALQNDRKKSASVYNAPSDLTPAL